MYSVMHLYKTASQLPQQYTSQHNSWQAHLNASLQARTTTSVKLYMYSNTQILLQSQGILWARGSVAHYGLAVA